jgi:hypothetical protein
MSSLKKVARRGTIGLVLFGALSGAGGSAHAALEDRLLANTTQENLSTTTSSAEPLREMFLNSLDYMSTIQIPVTGPMLVAEDTLTVQLRDGCGAPVGPAVSQTYDSSGITTPGSIKWLEFSIYVGPNGRAVNYGKYYSLDVHTAANSPLQLNTDRYGNGRLISRESGLVAFPGRKRDLVFAILGKTDSSKGYSAPVVTNVACPAKCLLVTPGGVEHSATGGTDNAINILFRERSDFSSKGSFWADFKKTGGITMLKKELTDAIQGTNGNVALANTFPYAGYFIDNNTPAYQGQYYPFMNFYIALEDPALDQDGPGGPMRGFDYCANVDAIVNVVNAPNGYGGAVGAFIGEIGRPGPNTTGWGANDSFIMVHELGGHGMAALDDEYINAGAQPGYTDVRVAKDVFGYQPNSRPLSSSGCNEWCGGTKSLNTLMSTMKTAGDTDYPCWAMTTQSQCTPATIPTGAQPACRWIGGLPPISYWGTHKCIPLNVARYDIGTSCSTHGNDGCYPLAPNGNPGAIMDVVQPNEGIMQSFHTFTPASGFGTHVENHIKDLLDCVLAIVPCAASKATRCTNLISRYGTPGNGYVSFLQSALACDATDGISYRRR